MTTIDKLDISVNNLYAVRTKMIEQINQQYHLNEAASIPPQTYIINNQPTLSQVDLLLGIMPFHTPWAYFYPPQQFNVLRRSSFTFSRIAPTLGSAEEQAKSLSRLQAVSCRTPEEEKEKAIIAACLGEVKKVNNWLGFVVGRIGQFLQG